MRLLPLLLFVPMIVIGAALAFDLYGIATRQAEGIAKASSPSGTQTWDLVGKLDRHQKDRPWYIHTRIVGAGLALIGIGLTLAVIL